MRTLIRLFVTIAAATVIAAVSVPRVAAAADDPASVTGQVTVDGRPAIGSEVRIRLWPTPERLAAAPRGSRVALPVVARGFTDASGRYQLRFDPDAVKGYQSSAGSFDAEVVATLDGRTARWSFSARTTKEVDLALAAGGGVDLCVIEAGKWFYNVRERFLEVHNWGGAKATVEQAVKADSAHTLGLGLKVGKGDWEARGRMTMVSEESDGAGARVSGIVNRSMYNGVNYREYLCRGWQSGEILERYVRPVSFHDLLSEPHTELTHVNLRKGCITKSSGTIWKEKGTNRTFRHGVDLPFIDLSAQSGFSAGSRVGFDIKKPTRICANTDEGWVKASRIELHSRAKSAPGAV